ncbi:hypothetical protein HRbin01_01519 [archaeon HR01]|nr:hypothetical protein HRbin01_01519 [archaeon HR01]
MGRPRICIVGNLTIDVLPSGERVPGGPPIYAGLAAKVSGCDVVAVSSVGFDYPPEYLEMLRGWGFETVLHWAETPSSSFAFSYVGGVKHVTLVSRGPPIPTHLLKEIEGDMVVYSPVASELAPQQLTQPVEKRCLDLQGFVRRADEKGRITLSQVSDFTVFKARIVHASAEEALSATATNNIFRAAEVMAGYGTEEVLIGLPDGVFYRSKDWGAFYGPVSRESAAERVGAGDILTGAFASCLVRGVQGKMALAETIYILEELLSTPYLHTGTITIDQNRVAWLMRQIIALD